MKEKVKLVYVVDEKRKKVEKEYYYLRINESNMTQTDLKRLESFKKHFKLLEDG